MPTESHENAPSLVYAIGRVSQGIQREMRARLRRLELSVPDFTAMSVLARQPSLSNAQLARRSMISPQSMLEVLSSLEDRGLVRRDADPNHNRILRAELTTAGLELLQVATPAIDDLQDDLFADLSREQTEMLEKGMLGAMRRLIAPSDAR